MVWIIVNYDLVGAPIPVIGEGVVRRSDVEIETAEPEALAVAAFDAPLMAAADAAREASMLKRMIDVIFGVIAAGIVADPLIIGGVNVRGVRVAVSVGISRRFLLWCSVLRGPSRSGPASGNMAVANIASLRSASVLFFFLLRESGNGTDQE